MKWLYLDPVFFFSETSKAENTEVKVLELPSDTLDEDNNQVVTLTTTTKSTKTDQKHAVNERNYSGLKPERIIGKNRRTKRQVVIICSSQHQLHCFEAIIRHWLRKRRRHHQHMRKQRRQFLPGK